MSYKILRKLLFKLPAETSHDLSLDWLGAANRLGLLKHFTAAIPPLPVSVMGIDFPNPVGLAAGLDKNADYLDALGTLGFGFVEVGTVTPRPQPGNPKPRLFRLEEHEAIINRMGFNNKGVDHLITKVQLAKFDGPIGINIGKNFDTPVESADQDYLICLRKAYAHADYITVNVSSPNTPGLRSLQFGESLERLLESLKKEQQALEKLHKKYVPIAVKIAPDMDGSEIKLVATALLKHGMDGVIASNTTLDRTAVSGHFLANEVGGLSGKPLLDHSTQVVAALYAELGEKLPIIGVGGINDGLGAVKKLEAGAKLVQIYSGFIYQGPSLIKDCVEAVRFR
jgi:dihydroorotate dehydrogenase